MAQTAQQPWWNFWKYLVDKNGNLVEVYSSFTKPTDKKVIKAIEKALN
jgi:glutathione peroxidase